MKHLLGGLAALLALTACSAPAPSAYTRKPSTTPATLPAPTGTQPVGATTVHLKDSTRTDPWVPGVKRELMVTLWYPAKTSDGRRAPYMTAKESELLLKGGRINVTQPGILSGTRTNAGKDAPPAGARHSLPLVVLSPGFTKARTSLTTLGEDLASRGYVVAAIDHTHENYATTFPDGRIAPCAACDVDDEWGFGRKVAEGRAADVSFVLDQLTGANPPWAGGTLIDPARIGMAGQSIGGAATLATLITDKRVRAGIDMDGTAYATIPKGGLRKPFMFLGEKGAHSPGGRDNSWDRDWKLLTGWKRWLVVSGATHQTFNDLPVLADTLGVKLGGTLTAARSVEVTRAYVSAFFDQHLGKRSQPLLQTSSERYPEVHYAHPPSG